VLGLWDSRSVWDVLVVRLHSVVTRCRAPATAMRSLATRPIGSGVGDATQDEAAHHFGETGTALDVLTLFPIPRVPPSLFPQQRMVPSFSSAQVKS